jgi:hypothetical protein
MMTMTEKTIKIPLTNNRSITMKFCKFDDNQWKCVMGDECLTDIVTFFNNGYYKMDTENKIQVEEK